ncbi:MAG: hypothetical protein CMO81_11320 [Waddliaceae bacterium]|nr:hypothetical protein [Waddliaceae bacterium]
MTSFLDPIRNVRDRLCYTPPTPLSSDQSPLHWKRKIQLFLLNKEDFRRVGSRRSADIHTTERQYIQQWPPMELQALRAQALSGLYSYVISEMRPEQVQALSKRQLKAWDIFQTQTAVKLMSPEQVSYVKQRFLPKYDHLIAHTIKEYEQKNSA